MADSSEGKSAAELQREIDMQRHRVEDTIDRIQEKLSPGQIVDELFTYSKAGGGEFLSGLMHTASKNPLPVALLGISLVWLIAKPGGGSSSDRDSDREWDSRLTSNGDGDRYSSYAGSSYGSGTSGTYAGSSGTYAGSSSAGATYDPYEGVDDEDYPTTSVQGSVLQRLGHVSDDAGKRYAEFVDDAGKKFRALTDEGGNRAGHFTDEAGNKFRGFTDAAGNRIEQFRDEAGNLLQEASGWASHTWAMVSQRLHDARDAIASGVKGVQGGASGLGHGAAHLSSRAGHVGGRLTSRASEMGGQFSNRASQMGGQVQGQANDMMRGVQNLLHDQPLVGGAVAFAIGAALGSALPRTTQEDRLMGEAADNLKGEAAQRAAKLYDQGKEQVGTLYETAQEKAARLYEQAKDGIDQAKQGLALTGESVVASLSSATSGTARDTGTGMADDLEDEDVSLDQADAGTTSTTTRTIY